MCDQESATLSYASTVFKFLLLYPPDTKILPSNTQHSANDLACFISAISFHVRAFAFNLKQDLILKPLYPPIT